MVDTLVRLTLCGLGVGAVVRLLAMTWKHALKVAVSAREQAYLAAAVSGYLAGFQFFRDYWLAAKMSLIIIGGYFLMKWVTQGLGRKFSS